MALNNFTPINENNTMAELTQSHNSIGNELSKPRNIFVILDEVERKVNNAQLRNITTESGLTKAPVGSRILDVKELGVYYYSASDLASKSDKPDMNSQDVVLVNTPTNNSNNVIQQVFPITTNDNAIQQAYRVVTGNTAGKWVYLKGNVDSKTQRISNQDLNTFMAVGHYMAYNCTNMPSGENEGLLKVYRSDIGAIVQEFISTKTNSRYHRTIGTNENLTWVKSLELEDIFKYSLGNTTTDGYFTFGLLIYKADNKTFEQAIRDHIIKTGQPTFTFYVQGGVTGNPHGTMSARGIFVSDTSRLTEGTETLHGVYYTISYTGTLITGAVSADDWRIPKGSDSTTTLWTGVKEFTSKTTEKMNYSSNDFDYFKIFVTIGATNSNSIYRQGFEFGKHSANKFKVSGVNVPSSGTTLEYFMCSISFDGDKFTIDEYNTKTNNKCYITEIVGINRPI
ncbi:tail fiber protein [Mammaliicoccus virus vB_MscM-PMS2]|nr:tail fiber protein [Mammaliicoccus virus vB_MscM-PMS2]